MVMATNKSSCLIGFIIYTMKKIGVFSGTFDPIHIAHVEACLVALAACQLDTVTVMVEKTPQRKQNVTSYKHRLAMAELATANYPSLRLLESPDENITIDNTLPLLTNQFGDAEFWYIAGSDMIKHMKDWPSIGKLFSEMKLCIILRSNDKRAEAEAELMVLKDRYSNVDYKVLPEVWSPVSSSVIRKEISKNRYSPLVHRDVLSYITRERLY